MNNQTQHIRYQATITDEAAHIFQQLLAIAEEAHHTTISRADIIQKLIAIDRRLINTCHEQITTMRQPAKTISNHEQDK